MTTLLAVDWLCSQGGGDVTDIGFAEEFGADAERFEAFLLAEQLGFVLDAAGNQERMGEVGRDEMTCSLDGGMPSLDNDLSITLVFTDQDVNVRIMILNLQHFQLLKRKT
jgi:hypothetical protein